MIQSQHEFARKEVLPPANGLDPIERDVPMDLRDKAGWHFDRLLGR